MLYGNLHRVNDLQPHIKNEFPQFWDLPISMDDIEYSKSDFDAANALLILDCILSEGKSKGLAIVLPDDPSVFPLIITECLLSLLMYDILQAETDLIGTLKVGDTAGLLSGRKIQKGIYKGKEVREAGSQYYRIEVKGCEYLIPDGRKWRIKPFSSGSTKGRRRQGVAIAGEDLEQLFGQPPGEILSIQKSKLLFVTGDKTILKSFSRSLKLGGDEFEALFPMADYTAVDRIYPVGRNPLGREPLLGFASAPDVAADVASQDKKQRLIVMEGKSKVTSSGSIERLRNLEHKPSLLFLLGPNDDAELKNLADAGVDCWVWSPSDFKRMPQDAASEPATDDHPFSIHQRLVSRLSKRSEMQKILELPDSAAKAVTTILSCLKEISSQVPDRLETGQLIGSCHRMLRDLSQISMPMADFEAFLAASGRQSARFDNRVEQLRDRFAGAIGYGIPTHLTPQVKEILASLAVIYESLKSGNPKYEEMLALSNDLPPEGMSIVCSDRDQVLAMRQWDGKPDGFTVVDQAGFTLDGVPSVLITGWLSRSFAKKSTLAAAENIIHLLYRHELKPFEDFNKYCYTGSGSMIDQGLRKRMFGGQMARRQDAGRTDGPPGEDMQSVLDLILAKFHPSANLHGIDHEMIRQSRLVVFDDGSYTYFSKDARLDRLDRQGRSIDTCEITEISPGDEIIVTDGSRELFEQLLSTKLSTPEYRKLKETASLWRQSLHDYMQGKNTSIRAVTEELAKAGCKREPGTIKKWLDGNVIIPEDNAVDVIAEVTGDDRLRNGLTEVKASCRAIHSLHTRIGQLLVRKILDARIKMEDEDMDDDLKKNIEDYANNARILTVQTVSSEEYPVPQGALGAIVSIS